MGIWDRLLNIFSIQKTQAAEMTDSEKATAQEMSAELRAQALAVKVTDFSNLDTVGEHGVYGILMETGYPESAATLVAFMTGDASIYFSKGGGMIGGGEHESVRKAAIAFTKKADEFVSFCKKTTSFPLPKEGQTIFYILTKDGIYTVEALESDLGNNKSQLSPLFYAGQDVITEYRLIEEIIK